MHGSQETLVDDFLPGNNKLMQGRKLCSYINSQYFWKWTNANPMKIFGQAATASECKLASFYTKPSLAPPEGIWFPANLGLVLT